MDGLTQLERSRQMALVRSKDTKPEMTVRRLVHSMGYRFFLHAANLPGKPDLIFPRRKKAIFVHGCFWHRHIGCKKATMPKNNFLFWKTKFDKTVARDQESLSALAAAGWTTMVVWECTIRDTESLVIEIKRFLDQ